MLNLECLEDCLPADVYAQVLQSVSCLPSGTSDLLKLVALIGLSNNALASSQRQIISATIVELVDDVTPFILSTIPSDAKGAIVTPHGNDIHFVLASGENPVTANKYHNLGMDESLDINFSTLNTFKFVAADSSATVDLYVTYYK